MSKPEEPNSEAEGTSDKADEVQERAQELGPDELKQVAGGTLPPLASPPYPKKHLAGVKYEDI